MIHLQATSDVYKRLMAGNHWFESCLYIGAKNSTPSPDTAFGEEMIYNMKTKKSVFANGVPEVGCCVAGEIDIEMILPDSTIPRMAMLVPYVRVTDGNEYSEWIQKGVYFIDTREQTQNSTPKSTLKIHGYDNMLKAGQPFDASKMTWPNTDLNVVKHCASIMGVTVRSDTLARINKSYSIPNPEEYTYREALGFIASMYAGNFTMDDLGRLRLIYLNEG